MDKKICQMVTDRLIAEMEKGVIPWTKPWHGSAGAISHTTGKPYSLLNQFVLGRKGEYITFNQCKAEGGSVKKGAKGCPVVFWKQFKITETDENGETKEKLIPLLKYYTVFHIDDCEGIKAKWDVETERPPRRPHQGSRSHCYHLRRARKSPHHPLRNHRQSILLPFLRLYLRSLHGTVHRIRRILQHPLSRDDPQHRTQIPPESLHRKRRCRRFWL